MNDINSIGFALDPANVPSFLLDWEITKRCNLDCSYCGTSIETGGHNNDTKHPPLEECLPTIDFMYEYVNEYMKYKKPTQRKVILNVYGGESLFHPDIIEILNQIRVKYQPYKDSWYLTVNCTTNGIVGKSQWKKIVPLIDNFTVSYHAENLPKQKQQYKNNILYLKQQNKSFRCAIMMHPDNKLWEDSESIIEFCKQHNINYTPKPVDKKDFYLNAESWEYTAEQFNKFKTFWISKVPTTQQLEYKKKMDTIGTSATVQSLSEGRPCCGGRKLSLNKDLKSAITFVPKQGFKGWSCSVNWFFLYITQLTGKVYTNRDCRMSTTNKREPIGQLSESAEILTTLKTQLATQSMPIIKCDVDVCMCGICAPKAESQEDFMELIKRTVPVDVFTKSC